MKAKSEKSTKGRPLTTKPAVKKSAGKLNSFLPYIIFFLVSFVYFCFFADYVFTYQEKNSLFLFTGEFLRQSSMKPGGLLIYVSGFLSSFYYYPATGALVLSLIITLITWLISRIIFLFSGKQNIVISITAGFLLFFMQTDYRFLLFNNLGFLFVIVLLLIAAEYPRFLQGWLPVILLPFGYLFAGGFIWIAFLSFVTYLLTFHPEKRYIKLSAAIAILAITVYVSREFLFFQNDNTLYFYPLSKLNAGLHTICFSAVSLLVVLLPAISLMRYPGFIRLRLNMTSVNYIASGVTLIGLILIAYRMFDRKNQQYFHTEKLFYQGRYEELIRFSHENPPTNTLSVFLTNVALCETGKLNDNLFGTPQSADGKTLFLKWEMFGEILKRGGYFYYAAGMINEAHRWAFENMVMKGLTPEDLKMIIKTELINGNHSTASKYISLLGKTVFYRKDAEQFRKFLNNEAAIEADPELGYKRKNKVQKDFFSITDDPFINVEMMLASGSLNKEALQYMTAYLLLKKDYQRIAVVLPEFEKFGYTKLPVNIEEAAAAISMLNKGQLPYLGNLKVSNETQARWSQFLTIFRQYNADARAAEPALRRQFGNTFWYYAFYK